MSVKELVDHLVVCPGVSLLVLTDLREIENITDYLAEMGIKCCYLHEEIEPSFRVKNLKAFANGEIEILITTPEFAKCILPRPSYSLS